MRILRHKRLFESKTERFLEDPNPSEALHMLILWSRLAGFKHGGNLQRHINAPTPEGGWRPPKKPIVRWVLAEQARVTTLAVITFNWIIFCLLLPLFPLPLR